MAAHQPHQHPFPTLIFRFTVPPVLLQRAVDAVARIAAAPPLRASVRARRDLEHATVTRIPAKALALLALIALFWGANWRRC